MFGACLSTSRRRQCRRRSIWTGVRGSTLLVNPESWVTGQADAPGPGNQGFVVFGMQTLSDKIPTRLHDNIIRARIGFSLLCPKVTALGQSRGGKGQHNHRRRKQLDRSIPSPPTRAVGLPMLSYYILKLERISGSLGFVSTTVSGLIDACQVTTSGCVRKVKTYSITSDNTRPVGKTQIP